MPIILAIEPDRRQAAQLTTVVRRRVGAELILAETTEGALDAIGNRVPDMVLVPALLSPQDDASLAAALRVIAAAAHVRTLTIPVLSNGDGRAAQGGLFSRWLRSRAKPHESEGCDPAVFAEQITAYLKEAAAERAELDAGEIGDIAPVVESPPVELAAPTLEVGEPPVELEWPSVEASPVEFAGPVLEPAEPSGDLAWLSVKASPVEAAASAVESGAPQLEFAQSVAEAYPLELAAPVVEAADPPVDTSTPPVELVALLDDASPPEFAALVVEATEPPIETAALAIEVPPIELAAPVVELVAQPVELVALADDASPPEFAAPVVEAAEPSAETSAPPIEFAEPVADAYPIQLADPVVEPIATAVEFVALVSHASPLEFSATVVEATEPPIESATLAVEVPPTELAATAVEPVAPSVEIAASVDEASPLEPAATVIEPIALDVAPRPEAADADARTIDLLAELKLLSTGGDLEGGAPVDEWFAGEPVGVHTIDFAEWDPAAVAEATAAEANAVAAAAAEETVVDEVVVEEAVTDEAVLADFAGWTEYSLAPRRAWPSIDGVQAEAPPADAEPPAEPKPVAARTKPLEWTELVASLRQDIERRREQPVPAADPRTIPRAANVATICRIPPDTRQKGRDEKGKPAQDEWGFFDPEQCGFAALLAKLEQVTVSPKPTDDVRRSA